MSNDVALLLSYQNARLLGEKISKLEDKIERLRGALEKIVSMDNSRSNEYHVASRALGGEEKDDG